MDKSDICLIDRNDINNNPEIIAKSDNFIFTFVKINGTSNIKKYAITKTLVINTNG